MSVEQPPVPALEFVPSTNALKRLTEHPIGFWFVFSGELAERASYYGMRTILALYMTSQLGYSTGGGATVMKIFMASCYITPFFGGWIADRYLGQYKTILYYSLPYILGHIILGEVPTRTGLYCALVLLAFGSGAIKPNTSVLMGKIYDWAGKRALLTEAFSLFYAAVNIGALITALGLPLIRNAYGYRVALIIPAALMAVAFVFFAAGKRFYPPEEPIKAKVIKSEQQRAAERKSILRLASVFLLIAVFWLVYDQNADTWIYFADKYCKGVWDPVAKVRHLYIFPAVHLFGRFGLSGTITADQVQGLNPVFIVILTPVFNMIWNLWKKARGGVAVPDTRKMLVGFMIVIITMAVMTFTAFLTDGGVAVTVWLVILATFIITLAELCISVVGLEFAYKQAAPGTQSIVTAGFHSMVSLGDYAGAGLAPFYENGLKPFAYFGIQALLMLAASIGFIPVSRKFEKGEVSATTPA